MMKATGGIPGTTAELPWERSLGNICSQKGFRIRKRQCVHLAREPLISVTRLKLGGSGVRKTQDVWITWKF